MCVGASFAWYAWKGSEVNVNVNFADLDPYIKYTPLTIKNSDKNKTLTESNDYTGGIGYNLTFNKNANGDNLDAYGQNYLKVTSATDSDIFKASNLKWTLVSVSNNTREEISTGNFVGENVVEGNDTSKMIPISIDFSLTKESQNTNYEFYLWLDSNGHQNVDISGKNITVSLASNASTIKDVDEMYIRSIEYEVGVIKKFTAYSSKYDITGYKIINTETTPSYSDNDWITISNNEAATIESGKIVTIEPNKNMNTINNICIKNSNNEVYCKSIGKYSDEAGDKPNNTLCNNLTYNGNSQQLVSSTSVNGYGYTLKDYTGKNAGDYTITASLKDNYVWKDGTSNDITFNCSINKKVASITANDQHITYEDSIDNSVSKITTSGLVTGHSVSSITLTPSTNNVITNGTITPSKATIVSDGTDVTSNYNITYNTGKLVIDALSIENAEITLNQTTYTYDGNEKKPTTTVVLNNKTLILNTDYTVSYSNNKNAGTATVTITGKGNYTGTKSINFTIGKKANSLTVTAKTLTYNKKDQALVGVSNAQGTVYYAVGTELTSSNYSSSGSATIPTKMNVGSYTVYYYTPGNGNYQEKKGSVISTINPYNLSNATIASISNQLYTGNEIKPAPAVTVPLPSGSTTTLVNGTDFNYSYSNNKNAGTATVTVTGKGNYTGTKSINFKIEYKTYTVTLNNQSATSAGTTILYGRYADGIYLDSAYSKKMTTSANAIAKPSKTGYTFGGYYTATNGGGTQLINASGNITSSFTNTLYNNNVTLYAKWIADSYTITFNSNGGTGSMSDLTMTYDTAKTLTANSFKKQYTVTYNYDGATGGNSNSSATANYKFVGWTKDGINLYSKLNLSSNSFTIDNDGMYYVSKSNTGSSGTYLNFFYNKRDDIVSGNDYTEIEVIKSLDYSGNLNLYVGDSHTAAKSQITGTSKSVSSLKVGNNYFALKGSTNSSPSLLSRGFIGVPVNTSITIKFRPVLIAAKYNNIDMYFFDSSSVKNLTTTNGGKVNLYADWNETSINLPTPTKTGYTFAGWYKSSSGGTKVGNGGTSYTPTSNVTLYAKWTANALAFNDKTITKSFSTSSQSDTINSASNGTGSYTYSIISGNDNSYFSLSGTNLTIKVSTPGGTYKLTVQAKDQKSGATKNATITITINKISNTLSVTAKTLTYNKKDQTLVSVSNAQGTVYYAVGTELTSSNYSSSGSTTIPTKMNAGSYTIYYYTPGNGNYQEKKGSVISKINAYNLSNATIASISNQTYTGNEIKPTPAVTVPLPSGSTTTLVNGTDFNYSYSNNKNAGTATVTVTGKGNYTGTKSINFTIVYKTYTITLDNQSATSAGTTILYGRYADGIYLDSAYSKKMTTSANPITKPSKTGNTFGGYYTATNGGGTPLINASGNITSSFTNTLYNNNVTLYAKWSVNNYTITFNANGGSVSTANKSVTYGSTYGDLPTPTRTGYTFIGWFTGNATRDSSQAYKDHPMLYYSDTYSDLYNAFGYNEKSLYNHYLSNGKSEGRRISQYISSDTVAITSNTTLYAGWYPNPNTYTITYYGNGGSSAQYGTSWSNTATYDSTYTVESNWYTRTGYTFAGWTTNSDGTDDGYGWTGWSGTWKYDNGQYGISNNTLNLYARWSVNSYTLSITKGTGVSTIYYKVNGASSYTSSTSNVSVSVNYGTTYYYYGTASTGYYMTTCTASSPCSGSMGTSNVSKSLTAYESVYQLYNSSGTSTGYANSLANAISNVSSGGTVKALKNNSSGAVTIDKNITFNTNGKTITLSNSITNSATTKITGSGTLYYSSGVVISNKGNLTISNSTIKTDYTAAISMSAGTMNVNGGTFVINASNCSNGCAPFVPSGGTLNINGGTYQGTNLNFLVINGGGTVNFGQTKSLTVSGIAIWNNSGTINFKQGTLKDVTNGITLRGGTANVSGGSITASGQAISVNGGETNITGGTLTGAHGILSSSGTVNITGGSIVGSSYEAIYNNGATVNIGTRDNVVKDVPELHSSNSFSFNNVSGTWNWYDGVLYGPKSTYNFNSAPSATETGYSAVTVVDATNGYKTYLLKSSDMVYRLFNSSGKITGYANSLANAISNTSSGGTMLALKNNTSAGVNVHNNVTLDTNGKTITMTGLLVNSAGYTLNIKGNGTITSSSSIDELLYVLGTTNLSETTLQCTSSNCKRVVLQRGTLNMSSGTIIHTAGSAVTSEKGTFKVTSGSIIGSSGNGISVSGGNVNLVTSDKKITVSGLYYGIISGGAKTADVDLNISSDSPTRIMIYTTSQDNGSSTAISMEGHDDSNNFVVTSSIEGATFYSYGHAMSNGLYNTMTVSNVVMESRNITLYNRGMLYLGYDPTVGHADDNSGADVSIANVDTYAVFNYTGGTIYMGRGTYVYDVRNTSSITNDNTKKPFANYGTIYLNGGRIYYNYGVNSSFYNLEGGTVVQSGWGINNVSTTYTFNYYNKGASYSIRRYSYKKS